MFAVHDLALILSAELGIEDDRKIEVIERFLKGVYRLGIEFANTARSE
jgi:hypothetical protein